MREELKQYGEEAYGLVESIANDIGPRIPGSENEKKLHSFMSDKLKGIGLNPKTESFIFAPYGSIGGLPMAGWAGIIGMIALVLGMIIGQFTYEGGFAVVFAALIYMVGLWIWLVCSVFKYKTWFDWAFKHAKSQNTYAELTPEDGEYDYTIYLSGHTDTSWCLKLSASQYKMGFVGTIIKLATGAVCVGIITLLVFVGFIISCGLIGDNVADFLEASDKYLIAIGVLAPFLIVGAFFLTMYNERTEAMASPGAMDNATGIAIAYETIKYFKENPDKMPARCRIIDANIGAEESGLRGSIAFTRRHKDDGMLDHAYHINIDSVADKDNFEVIHGDSWLCPHFDKTLKKDFMFAMKEAGIAKPGDIANPVGGCDSTPFQKAGVKSITFAAQNPIMSNYYHTYMDVPERFDAETVGLGLDVVLRVIDKIALREQKKAEKATNAHATKENTKVEEESEEENDVDALFNEEASSAVIKKDESAPVAPAQEAQVAEATSEEKAEEPKAEEKVEETVQEPEVKDEPVTEEAVKEDVPVEEPVKEEEKTEEAEETKDEVAETPEEKVEEQPAEQPEDKVEEPVKAEETPATEESKEESAPAEEPAKEEEKAEEPAKEDKAEEPAKEEPKQEEKAEEQEKKEEPEKEEGPKKLKTTCPNCKTKIMFTEADKTMTCPNCGKTYRNSVYSGYKR